MMDIDELIRCWRINYGLDTRTPVEAAKWWQSRLGWVPVGVIAALGTAIDEIERLCARVSGLEDRLLSVYDNLSDPPISDELCRAMCERIEGMFPDVFVNNIDVALKEE